MFWLWKISCITPRFFTQQNVKFWKGFPSNFGGNLSYFTLCLRENLTMTNLLHYPLYKIAVLKNCAIFTAKFMWTAVSGITENTLFSKLQIYWCFGGLTVSQYLRY